MLYEKLVVIYGEHHLTAFKIAQMGNCCEYCRDYYVLKNISGRYTEFGTFYCFPIMLSTTTIYSMEMESKCITYFAEARKEIKLTPEMVYKFNSLTS